VTFTPPAKTRIRPDEVELALPAAGTAATALTLTLEAFARLGSLRFPFVIAGADKALNMQGHLELSVADPVPQVRISQAAATPRIDGGLDDAAWKRAPLIPELRLLRGKGVPTEKTAVWMTYDRKGIYVAVRCFESQMDKIVARFTDRGAALYREDDVEVFIRPPGAATTYQFAVNALGTRSDNFGNDADWHAAARRHEDAWTVELFIPYPVLDLAGPPATGTVWPLQVGRQQKPKLEVTAWTPGSGFNEPAGFGEIVFE